MWLYASFPLLSVWCVQVYNGLSINIIAFPSFSMHLASVLTTKSLHFLKLMMHSNFYLLPFLVWYPLKTSPCTTFPAFCSCFSGFSFRIPYNFSMLAVVLCFFLT
ncbi:hypothetical protein Peur_020183 [Populus x canadensis]